MQREIYTNKMHIILHIHIPCNFRHFHIHAFQSNSTRLNSTATLPHLFIIVISFSMHPIYPTSCTFNGYQAVPQKQHSKVFGLCRRAA